MINLNRQVSGALQRGVLLAVARRLERMAVQRLATGNASQIGQEVAAELFSLASDLEAESNAPHGLRGTRGL